jgi:hypothetical protein
MKKFIRRLIDAVVMKFVNRAYSWGRYYIVLAHQGAGSPMIDKAFTNEQEGAHRKGQGFLIRLPFMGEQPTKGIVIGRWKK